jgi:hypothetical protein
MLVLGLVMGSAGCSRPVSVVESPPADLRNRNYVSNRAPLQATPLVKLPVGAVRPGGWLREQLRLQAEGFHGHLGEISAFLKKEGNAWLDLRGEGDHGWEEVPYWLKGYSNAAWLLDDPVMKREAMLWIEAVLAGQKPDGWFGPDRGRGGAATRLTGRDDLWPNMIMLFVLQDYHDVSGDGRVIELMTRYFRYLLSVPEERLLQEYWPRMRGGDLLFSVLWLYNRTGEEWLLDLSGRVHRQTAPWSEGVIDWHNVNMSQGFGEPATWWLQSGQPADRQAAERNFTTIRRSYGQVPGGMFGGDENCRPGFTDPRQGIETCGMVEMMLSTETLLWITGEAVWGDRCEDVAFNSLPAALDPDLRSLRYLTAPNLVLSDRTPKDPGLQNGGPMLAYDPWIHRCCQHNWGHGWPYLIEHLWLATSDDGLAAAIYGPSEVTARVGEGVPVRVVEETRYPFSETLLFTLHTESPVVFPIYLRVPGWCRDPEVTVAGERLRPAAAGGWLRLERRWSDGDRVELRLPMRVSLRRWEANQGSVSVDRGPLTYSLEIAERWIRSGGTEEWPAWEVRPDSPWNYGLELPGGEADADLFEVVERAWPGDDRPFTRAGTPIALRARGRRIPEWGQDTTGLVMPLQSSPVLTSEPLEELTLIPMGAARLRISVFPVTGTALQAHRWSAPPPVPEP